MSTFNFLHEISIAGIRDYLITHRVDQGDTIVLNASDYMHVLQEAKNASDEVPDLPLKLFGVLIISDNTDSVPTGKVQIVKNETI
ncbi:hypothetical protein [Flavobacterium silvaticum]|uniref:Uncharacterized protein n=1 Tax=Flavobacterium silvaticum TaxID=1852020 RepID=A0A972JEX5_9FLAO|nr:hypothetical protein [Flavobacterium silvaticum]NMH27359.1 hypothetical protein [Flavobacterium silvaticum]